MAEPTDLEYYFLDLVNGTRADAGVPPLTFNDDLMESAEAHNNWMDATDTPSHTGEGGSTIEGRIRAAGYDGIYTGENIWNEWGTRETGETAGETSFWVEESHKWYLNSKAGHYEAMINPNFQHIGIDFKGGDFQGYPAAYSTLNFGGNGPDADPGGPVPGGPGEPVPGGPDEPVPGGPDDPVPGGSGGPEPGSPDDPVPGGSGGPEPGSPGDSTGDNPDTVNPDDEPIDYGGYLSPVDDEDPMSV